MFMLSDFSYNAVVLETEGSKLPMSDFFLTEILQLAKAGKSKQSSLAHDLVSALSV